MIRQTTLDESPTAMDNTIWGDPLNHSPDSTTFRWIFQNVNTLNCANDWAQWKAVSTGLSEMSASGFAFQETNMAWNIDREHQVTSILRRQHKHIALATSTSSEDTSLTPHKRGGTATGVLGKHSGRKIKSG